MASVDDRWWKTVREGEDLLRVKTERHGRGRRYQVRWREHPGAPEKTESFDRKVDADRRSAEIDTDLSRGTFIDPKLGKQTWLAYADEWAQAQDWKATTREAWGNVRSRLVPHLGAMPLAAIDRLKLQAIQQELGKRYARSTVEVTMSYAGAVMRSAFADGRIPRDPTQGLRAPKARAGESDGVGPEQVPTRAEALTILNSAPSMYRAAVALGLAGLRVGEVLGMAPDRVDLETRQVTVDQQLQRVGGELVLTTPKAEKTRTITVPGLVAVELRRHLRDHHEGDGLLFGGRRGTPMMRRDQFYASAWRPALKAAGLDERRYVFHSLRHWCASTLLAEGAPLTAVAAHLGDTVETVSRTYVHWLRDETDVPSAVLDRVLAPVADQPRTEAR